MGNTLRDDSDWRIRLANDSDVPEILAVIDGAAAWLVANGLIGQWGDSSPSNDLNFVQRLRGWIDAAFVSIATNAGNEIHGCLVVGYDAPPYLDSVLAEQIASDTAYIYTLVTRKAAESAGAGAALLHHATVIARRQDKSAVYLDCWAENPKLRAYYERQGFEAVGTFPSNRWNGLLLKQAVPA